MSVTLATVALAAAGLLADPRVYPGCAAPPPAGGRTVAVDGPEALATAIRQARAGDVITLAGGSYGKVAVEGDPGGFATITAADGATPDIASLVIGGRVPTAHWVVRGLTVSGPGDVGTDVSGAPRQTGWPLHSWKVTIDRAEDIVLEDDVIETVPGDYPWAPESKGVQDPTPLASGVSVSGGACVAVIRDKVHNVFNGVVVGGHGGASYLLADDTIDQFAGDGIDHFASHVLISHNTITDGHDLCANLCIHTDAIQGWTENDNPALTNTDVVIDGNLIVTQTRPDLPMPADDLHGIAIFDGHWDGLQITNNVVVGRTWNGISVFGARRGSIADNTVVAAYPQRQTMIWVAPAKPQFGRVNADDLVVRNNITSALKIDTSGVGPAGVSADHNLVAADPRRLFVAFDPDRAVFDLHLRADSPARGKGAADGAPPTDLEGKPRVGTVDLGAYAGAAN